MKHQRKKKGEKMIMKILSILERAKEPENLSISDLLEMTNVALDVTQPNWTRNICNIIVNLQALTVLRKDQIEKLKLSLETRKNIINGLKSDLAFALIGFDVKTQETINDLQKKVDRLHVQMAAIVSNRNNQKCFQRKEG